MPQVTLNSTEWNLIEWELKNRLKGMETELKDSEGTLTIYQNRYELFQTGSLDFENDPFVRIELKDIDQNDKESIEKKLVDIISCQMLSIEERKRYIERVKQILAKHGGLSCSDY